MFLKIVTYANMYKCYMQLCLSLSRPGSTVTICTAKHVYEIHVRLKWLIAAAAQTTITHSPSFHDAAATPVQDNYYWT